MSRICIIIRIALASALGCVGMGRGERRVWLPPALLPLPLLPMHHCHTAATPTRLPLPLLPGCHCHCHCPRCTPFPTHTHPLRVRMPPFPRPSTPGQPPIPTFS
jgi:hypothetical protein